jgi:hypothetical protein
MNSFDTLFFPETDLFNERHYPLLLFFTPLHFLQVVESRPDPVVNPEAEIFLERGLLQTHVPAPLGDKREQFLRLIRDINGQEEHLVNQLKEMTTDSSPAPSGGEFLDSKHIIVSSLLQEYGMKLANTGMDLQLWQARLVLVIAEILDSNEEDLREQLSFFSENEIATFRALQDRDGADEEDIFNELDNIKAELEKSRLGGVRKRFDAWLRLLQNHAIPPVKVWLAATREYADQIFNRYESVSNMHAVPLLKLVLPAQMTGSGRYLAEQIEKFQRATVHIHRGLVTDFERIMATVPYVHGLPESLLPYGTDWAEQWEGILDDFFPAGSEGRIDITFYLLPDQPLARLLSLRESPENSRDGVAAHGLLALLGPSAAL